MLTTRRAALHGLAAPLFAMAPTAGWTAEALVVDLKDVPAGALPASFTTARTGQGAPSTWLVQEDASVPGGRVITQTSNDKTDYRFPLAIYQPFSGTDVEVTVRFKAVAGSIDRAGGIVLRLIDPNNYYVLRANALEDNVNFYHVIQGVRRQIEGAAARSPPVSGTPLLSKPNATSSPPRSMANPSSRRRIIPSLLPARSRFGRKPTASPASLR